MSQQKNIIQQMEAILEEASKFDDLSKEIETSKFVDKSSNKEYESIEQAFRSGIKDFTNFQEKKERVNPKLVLSKMINENKISEKEIKTVQSFLDLVKNLDADAEYNKKYRYLMNMKSKAKREGNLDKIKELEDEKKRLNDEYGKTNRKE